jgi:amino acid transporter
MFPCHRARENDMSKPMHLAAIRRYQLRQAVCMIAYALVLVAVITLFRENPPPLQWRPAIAVLPATPILGIVAALACYLMEETDEFRRMRVIAQLLWGLAVTLSATTVWGFLETLAGFRHLPAFYVFPVFCVGMLSALPVIWWKYR